MPSTVCTCVTPPTVTPATPHATDAARGAVSEVDKRRLAYVIHEAVCTAYKHEGRNALCERAATAVYASEWFDSLMADARSMFQGARVTNE